jgi:hypothetical protein
MQYLVSVENTNYFYWQLELLIESFLMHGLQDSLVIAMAENEDPKLRGYSKNLVKYGSKVIHTNVGRDKGCLVANRFYAIRNLLELGQLQYPFTIMHSDMILKNPIDKYNKDADIVMNNYGINKNYLTIKYLEDIGLKQKLIEEQKAEESEIDDFPFSMPIIFNESLDKVFAKRFFDKLVMNLEEIIKTEKPSFPVERTCWTQTLLESVGFYSATGSFLTCELMHSEDLDVPFIHYKNGIPPVFSKKFFKFDRGRYVDGPYENLLEHNPTENTDYLHQVIRSYIKRNR